MALTTSQLRTEYAHARCDTSRMVRVPFPRSATRSINLLVEQHTAKAWVLFAAIMGKHRYYFRESAGGTYNCRKIAGSSNYSLHSYGLALDLNPSRNPFQSTLKTDMPRAFRDDLKRIKTGNGKRVFEWGGDWSGRKDAMHWEVDVSHADLRTGVSHPDLDGPGPDPDPSTEEDDAMLPLKKGDGMGDRAHKNHDVRVLQYLLNKHHGAGLTVDGKFGATTAKAAEKLGGNGEFVSGMEFGRLLWRVGQHGPASSGGGMTQKDADGRYVRQRGKGGTAASLPQHRHDHDWKDHDSVGHVID